MTIDRIWIYFGDCCRKSGKHTTLYTCSICLILTALHMFSSIVFFPCQYRWLDHLQIYAPIDIGTKEWQTPVQIRSHACAVQSTGAKKQHQFNLLLDLQRQAKCRTDCNELIMNHEMAPKMQIGFIFCVFDPTPFDLINPCSIANKHLHIMYSAIPFQWSTSRNTLNKFYRQSKLVLNVKSRESL